MAAFVSDLVIVDEAFPVGATRNDGDDCALPQVLSQCVCIISLVSEQVSCAFQSSQEMGSNRTVCSITTGQQE